MRRLNSVSQTLGQIQKLAGLSNPQIDRLDEHLREREETVRQVSKILDDARKPIAQIERNAQRTEQKVNEVRQQLEGHNTSMLDLENNINLATSTLQAKPTDANLQQQLQGYNEQKQRAAMQRASIEEQLLHRENEATVAKGKLDAAMRQVDEALEARRGELEGYRAAAEQLSDRSRALYEEVTKGRTLAETGEMIDVNADQFDKAMTHHRDEARLLLVATLAAVLVLAYAVFKVFNLDHAAELVPKVVPKGSILEFPKPGLDHVLMVFGGRISVVAGAAWVVAFLGKLHARHSQQAVSYQDKKAGLGVIGVLVQHGTQETREATMKRMTEFYFTQDDNAFREPPTREATLKDVRKLLTTMTEPVGKAVESIATGIGKAKG